MEKLNTDRRVPASLRTFSDKANATEPRATSPISEPAHELFTILRVLGHGRVENLAVAGGQPRITAKTKLFQRYRVGTGAPVPPYHPTAPNPKPHRQHLQLIERCRAIGDGVIDKVEVADGLPVHWSSA